MTELQIKMYDQGSLVQRTSNKRLTNLNRIDSCFVPDKTRSVRIIGPNGLSSRAVLAAAFHFDFTQYGPHFTLKQQIASVIVHVALLQTSV